MIVTHRKATQATLGRVIAPATGGDTHVTIVNSPLRIQTRHALVQYLGNRFHSKPGTKSLCFGQMFQRNGDIFCEKCTNHFQVTQRHGVVKVANKTCAIGNDRVKRQQIADERDEPRFNGSGQSQAAFGLVSGGLGHLGHEWCNLVQILATRLQQPISSPKCARCDFCRATKKASPHTRT